MKVNSLTVQDYEAIAAGSEHSAAGTRAVLILDTSSCAAALGICQENARPQIAGIWNPDTETTFEERVGSAFDWSGYADELKNAVRKYYLSERSIDPVVPGLDRPVSTVVRFCEENAAGSLEVVFRSVDALLADHGIDPTDMRILLTGPLASFFPLEAVVRCHFSPAMPMMPDSRYHHCPDPDSILREGRELLEQFNVKQLADPVVWQTYRLKEDGSAELSQFFLALPDTKTSDLETPVYAGCGGVFVCSGDSLTVTISGNQQQIPVPEAVLRDGAGTVDLGLQYRDDSFLLLIRSTRTPDASEYPVNVRLKGNQ